MRVYGSTRVVLLGEHVLVDCEPDFCWEDGEECGLELGMGC
jgi:hypothetical protein